MNPNAGAAAAPLDHVVVPCTARSTRLILNPFAGSAPQRDTLEAIVASRDHVDMVVTEGPGHATELARQALDDGIECIAAAGGDGTIHEVVQGLAGRWSEAALLPVPLGTGNDLARSLGLPDDPEAVLDLLVEGYQHDVDVIRLEVDGRAPNYVINVAAGGLSDLVDSELDKETKSTWGPLSYLRAAASVGLQLPSFDARIEWDDGTVECADVISIVVANARTAAGGIRVAPHARLDDGLVDVVAVLAGSGFDIAGVAAALASGDYTQSDCVLHRCSRSVSISSTPPMWFNADGERFSNEPITFTCLHRVLRVIVPG